MKVMRLQLAEHLKKETGIKQKLAEKILSLAFAWIRDQVVEKGNEIEIRNFGTFKPKIRKARRMGIPYYHHKKFVDLPRRRKLGFIPSPHAGKILEDEPDEEPPDEPSPWNLLYP